MQLSTLTPRNKGKDKKRIGRGGKRGTTSGKGTKGQKSRSGHRIRPAERDIIKRLPKLRGYRFQSQRDKAVPVSLARINKVFESGETVTPKSLAERGLIRKEGGVFPVVKLLADGDITKKLTIERCLVSATAKAKVEKAGGTVK